MSDSKRRYTSARERLLQLGRFGPFFQGSHTMQLFGWSPKAAAHYLWLWSRQRLVKPLGGKSDVFFNLVADPSAENHVEAAIRRVMPGAVVGPFNVLHDSGVTTQRTGSLQLLVRPNERRFSIDGAQVETRPPSWWMAIERVKGTDPGGEESLARLLPGAAIADSAMSGAFDPDDIDFDAVEPSERRRAIRMLKVVGSPVWPGELERSYTAAWLARRGGVAARRVGKSTIRGAGR